MCRLLSNVGDPSGNCNSRNRCSKNVYESAAESSPHPVSSSDLWIQARTASLDILWTHDIFDTHFYERNNLNFKEIYQIIILYHIVVRISTKSNDLILESIVVTLK